MSTATVSGEWTSEELMQGKAGVPSSPPSSPSKSMKKSTRKLAASGKVDPMDWGTPGHLTEEEVATFMKFRDEVEKRGGEFKSTVYSFGDIEGEAFCLTRWLRARKFKYDDVIAMIEEATEVRTSARGQDFYPDPVQALGCEPSVFMAQYPQLYHGHAKNGCPVFISKPGVLNVDGMECITTLDGILKFHWHVMMHDYTSRLKKHKEANPDFVNFQCVTVIDLEHLSTSQLNQRALSILKTQTAIDSVCFPETMNKTLVINAPRFFSLTWNIIKGWIDPRTAGKIELISNRKNWEARLRELVDVDQLPSDYGGKGMATTATLASDVPKGVMKQKHELVHVRTSGSSSVEVPAGGSLHVTVFTRSQTEVIISVVDETSKSKVYAEGVSVKHTGGSGDNDKPTSVVITKEHIKGPVKAKIKIQSKGGRFSTAGNYMVACNIY
mmetsp:Transcript_5621/g.10905  ORF Transcript_5621/g.10905 Transcript_5621/m.10905 type:complete len:440 (-) Transcript_5621:157-1476(-)|eukprot:CAMPEP_0201660298 /NCGR_PEP_ID=MMETSP0494-20130426/2964_1 /ASSEMBLY_ACC=CAM_ASM_000839 /TAXON_ID=420259 /ORGANISM="Thalassiosira gravida, Strain GMp14c1" /LENGTH=439 /DNA_ID=CAMNT_0048138119 /DNA_START=108 /DNA_END=1427 /DNA_ORIENTATION=+